MLFQAPWGLQPPGAPPREGADGHAFLENYEGGWQELFPSCNDPCDVPRRRDAVPRRGGDAAVGRPRRASGEVGSALPRRLPTRAVRAGAAHAARGRARCVLERAVANTSATSRRQFVWGHHCVLGPPFVEAGCRLDAAGADDRDDAGGVGGRRPASRRASARRGRTRQLARRRHGRPARRARAPRPAATTTSTSTDLDGRLRCGREPAASASRFRLELGRGGVPLGHLLAALRRRRGDAAGGLLRARHGAVVDAAPLAEAAAAGEALVLAPGEAFSTELRARTGRADTWPA